MLATLAARFAGIVVEERDDAPTLVIPPRFCGPPGSGNGGYVAGRLAGWTGARGPVEVTLRRPAPLATPLRISRGAAPDPAWMLSAGDDVIAEARCVPAGLDAEPPAPVRRVPPALTSSSYPDHPFPDCFVCGPGRAPGDGLKILPSPARGAGGVVATRWTPPADLADTRGRVDPAIVWAALDCPGYFAIAAGKPLRKLLLGRMTASIEAPLVAGEPYTVIAWPLGSEGRRHEAATAILGADSRLRARSRQVWIAPREG